MTRTGLAGRGRCGVAIVLLTGMSVIIVACGTPGSSPAGPARPVPASRPAVVTQASSPGTRRPAASRAAGSRRYPLIKPPFGRNARVVMTPWLPASASQAQAVTTAKNFLLAVLYATYTGGQDHRWKAYAGSFQVLSVMRLVLASPYVTTESWTGTIRIWHMNAAAGTSGANTISVTECVDSSHVLSTSLRTGKVLPPSRQLSPGHDSYKETEILARNAASHWAVISFPPVVFYPEAAGCRP